MDPDAASARNRPGEEAELRDRLLAAFQEIEAFLTERYGSGRRGAFTAALRDYEARQHPPKLQIAQLERFNDMRVLLAHQGYLGNQSIATPTQAAVEAIERLVSETKYPPTMLNAPGRREPYVAKPTDSVEATLQMMYAHEFSQVPIYEGQVYFGLLTTNTVARWVAKQMRQQSGLAEDSPVSDALQYVEPGHERVLHKPSALSVAQTLWLFSEGARLGKPVTAVIITQQGRRNEKPLRLIVPEDLSILNA